MQTGSILAGLTTLNDLVGQFHVTADAAAIMTLDQTGAVVTHTYSQIAAEGLDAVLRHSRPARIVTAASHLPALEAAGVDVGADCVLLDQDRGDIASRNSIGGGDAADQFPAPDHVGALLYTSGTTGQPNETGRTTAWSSPLFRRYFSISHLLSKCGVFVA